MKNLKFELIGKLSDGTPVSLDEFATGGTISIIDASGNKSTAPDGDYTFEDGSVATVTDGKISAITSSAPADSNDTSANTSPAEQDATEQADTVADEADAQADGELADQIGQIMQILNQLTSDVAELKAKQTQLNTDFEKERTVTAEKFSAVSAPSSVQESKPATKKLTYAEQVVERVKYLHKK